MIYGADKLGVDGNTHKQTDAGNANTRRPKLSWVKMIDVLDVGYIFGYLSG